MRRLEYLLRVKEPWQNSIHISYKGMYYELGYQIVWTVSSYGASGEPKILKESWVRIKNLI